MWVGGTLVLLGGRLRAFRPRPQHVSTACAESASPPQRFSLLYQCSALTTACPAAAAINAGTLALIDAGVAMRDFVVGCGVAYISRTPLLGA